MFYKTDTRLGSVEVAGKDKKMTKLAVELLSALLIVMMMMTYILSICIVIKSMREYWKAVDTHDLVFWWAICIIQTTTWLIVIIERAI